jgi:hypothetical protein
MRIPECQNLINMLGTIEGEVERAQGDEKKNEEPDIMWAEVKTDTVLAQVKDLIVKLRVLIPHAVCTNCQGKLKAKCGLCHGRGLISRFRWDTVPDDVKKIRAKELKESAKEEK